VRHGAERAEVAGTLDLSRAPRELKQWLEEQAVSVNSELQVRRVVGADGRSRAYLNGQAVAVQLLREAGSILIDIHGQHEFQSLTRSAAQRELLDGYAGLNALTSQVGIAHRVWLELLNRTLDLETRARDRDAKLELLRYQAQELAALQLAPGELERLTEEHARLANRGRLAAGAQAALATLYENEGASAHSVVSRALSTLKGLAALDPKLAANDLAGAVAAINLVRASRTGVPAYDGTGQTAAQIKAQIIEDRRRELFLEGHRLGDARRYNIAFAPAAGAAYTTGGGVYGTQNCFPLPDVERVNNPNIAKTP
jgi:DNA repair protein RecN (Recombination protein N)